MNPEMNDSKPQETSEPQVTPQVKPSNKKLIYGIIAGVAILLIVLIGLVVALLLKSKPDNDATSTSTSSQQSDSGASTTTSKKEVVKTIATNNDKFEILLYTPRQTGSNTTIEYGLHNKCKGCQDKEFVSDHDFIGYSKDSEYILDENAAKKYSPIVDADGKVLASDTCAGYVAPGKTIDCFIAFTKVASGTTVSVVLGDVKIDDVLIK